MIEWNLQGAFGRRLELVPIGHLVDHHSLGTRVRVGFGLNRMGAWDGGVDDLTYRFPAQLTTSVIG